MNALDGDRVPVKGLAPCAQRNAKCCTNGGVALGHVSAFVDLFDLARRIDGGGFDEHGRLAIHAIDANLHRRDLIAVEHFALSQRDCPTYPQHSRPRLPRAGGGGADERSLQRSQRPLSRDQLAHGFVAHCSDQAAESGAALQPVVTDCDEAFVADDVEGIQDIGELHEPLSTRSNQQNV